METKNWMKALADHYENMRRQYPDDKLLILFDIDGTILDMRYMILFVLRSYDREFKTNHFRHLKIRDIYVHENHIDQFLQNLNIPDEQKNEILRWYSKYRWSPDAILESHRPFHGVLEVIRWFQMQPNTFVGLNTGRPEELRYATLFSLNELSKEYRVRFRNDFLHMNPLEWEKEVGRAKTNGIKFFREKGYHVFAVVDNEPHNLQVIGRMDNAKDILLLHTDSMFGAQRTQSGAESEFYDITEFMTQSALPQHIQFVWHGVNNAVHMRQFLASNIHWAEFDVRLDPLTHKLVLRSDSFEDKPLQPDEEILFFNDWVEQFKKFGRGLKLDLKESGNSLEQVLQIIGKHDIEDSQLWFNGNIDQLKESGFKRLAQTHPQSIVQCSVDFLFPLIIATPSQAKEILTMFRRWGINRFSVSWQTPYKRKIFEQMEQWEFDVNIYDVPNLEAFLQATLLLPRSITSDFNFPQWQKFSQDVKGKLETVS